MSTQALKLSQPARIHASVVGLIVVAAVAAAVLAFSGPLAELVKRWKDQEEYSHGFLIPLISLWLLWARRDELLARLGRPSWAGLAVIVFAAAMHIIGEYSSLFILSHIAFILVLVGIALAAGGYPLLKAAFVPIALLIFSIPLPYFIESKLTLQLQLISSQLGVAVINLFQIPVYLEGNVIDLGYYKLQVVEACSGLRYLYPLLSISFIAAYFFQAPFWQRLLVFLSGIPITIGMNGFRIGMVGVTVDRWGSQMADGFLHFFEGWVIFIACAALLVGEIWLLARLSGRTFFQVFHLPAPLPQPVTGKPLLAKQTPLLLSLLAMCATGVAIHAISHRPIAVLTRTPFAEFPPRLGAWRGRTAQLDVATERGLGLDDYILSDYSEPNGRPVNFYVAYYSSQRNGYAPHSPTVCIPGDGWLITHLEEKEYRDGTLRFPFNRVIIERGNTKQLVYYWFDERGRKIANEYWAKWYLLADAVTQNRTDGSLIRLVTQVFPGETESDADRRLHSFMRELLPKLDGYLPASTTAQSPLQTRATTDHG